MGQSDQNHGVVKCSLNPTVIVLFTCKTETLSYYSLIVLYRFNIDENWRIINLCVYHKSGFGYKSWRFSTKSVLWENEVYGRETFVMFRQNVILNRSWKRSKIFTKSRDIANLIKKSRLCVMFLEKPLLNQWNGFRKLTSIRDLNRSPLPTFMTSRLNFHETRVSSQVKNLF